MSEPHIRFPAAAYLIISFFFIHLTATAQSDHFTYGVAAAAYAGNEDSLPFWLYSNTGGGITSASPGFTNRLYGSYARRDTSRSLQFSAGFDVNTRLSSGENSFFFRQLYAQMIYRGFRASAGRFYDPMGVNDRTLSMGSMLVSRNATPVPKVRAGTDGFTSIPRTGGHIQINTMLAHGWFGDRRYIDDPYLHQKFLYLRYRQKRFDLTVGAAHNVIWGGRHPGVAGQSPYQLPSSFSDFVDVLFGQAASGSNAPQNEITNAVGNSVAAYEVKAGVNFAHFRLKAYRQFYLEDKVALRFRSPWDGLWGAGIEFDNSGRLVTQVLWEHLNTKRQNAWENTSLGRSNYYNNGVYRTGWTYEGNVLGNPLLVNGPTAVFDGGLYPVSNNMIVAHHVGIRGQPTGRLSYKAYVTYSRNYGTAVDQGEGPPYKPLDELRVDQLSSFLRLRYNLLPDYGLSLSGSVAYDNGELYSDNRLGVQLGIRWEGGDE